MITNAMIGKVYDRINFWDHGEEGIAEGLEQVFRENLGELLAGADDLDRVQDAFVRERVIRDTMAKTGEDRATVTDMLDALGSMGQEAVLDLTEGEPTTLRDALQRYVSELETRDPDGDELTPVARVTDELGAILAYPWSEEEALISLHDPHYGMALHITEAENRDLEIRMGSNRWLVATVNWEDAGSGGQRAAELVAHAVYRATLARVIPDRDHHVQLNAVQTRDMRAWLASPRGSLSNGGRLSLDAVAGGGVLVRTRPFSHQSVPRTEV